MAIMPAPVLSRFQNDAAAAIRSLVVALADIRCETARPLAVAGLDPHFDDVDGQARPDISRDQFARFSRISLRTLDCHAARRDGRPPCSLSNFWLMYSCAIAAPTLRSAIETSSAIHRLINRGEGYLAMDIVGDNVQLTFRGMRREGIGDDLRSIYGLSSSHRFFSWLTGIKIPLNFSEAKTGKFGNSDLDIVKYCIDPSDFPHYVEFNKIYLDLPVIKNNSDIERLPRSFLFDIFSYREGNSGYAGKVLDIVEQYIRHYEKIPGATSVARSLAVSPATLRRRLEEEETSFLDIRQSYRMKLVKSFLTNTQMSLDEIASRVGYSDATAIRRAFRSSTGITPSDWRAMRGGSMKLEASKNLWRVVA